MRECAAALSRTGADSNPSRLIRRRRREQETPPCYLYARAIHVVTMMHRSTAPTTMHTLVVVVVVVSLQLLAHVPAARAGLISLIQNNALGSAVFHKQQSWPFDPYVSARRAPEFIALHGDKSEKLIERIGLGLDGRQEERRRQQLTRDFLYDQQQQQQQLQDAAGAVYPEQQQQQRYPSSQRLQILSSPGYPAARR